MIAYYSVELGQTVGVSWCHFVLGMTEAQVSFIKRCGVQSGTNRLNIVSDKMLLLTYVHSARC